jgi:hypothetical protein
MMAQTELSISDEDRQDLLEVLEDVSAGRAFLSLGEMSTITGWSSEDLSSLVSRLTLGFAALSTEESRFLWLTLATWHMSARKGPVVRSGAFVERIEHLQDRLKQSRFWAGK